VKRRSDTARDRRLDELPPELRVFRVEDWTRDTDPPDFDEIELPVCDQHDRRGCLMCFGVPRAWTPDQRQSILYYERYSPALERWAWQHGLTLDDVLVAINAAEGGDKVWEG